MSPEQRNGIKCQYCNIPTITRVLKYGTVAQCPFCYDSYVSMKNSIPSGCVANQTLRKLRRETHILINAIIDRKMRKDMVNNVEAKEALYAYIQKSMNYDFVFDSLSKLDYTETILLNNFLNKI